MFIPINFEHEVTKKLWGALELIYKSIRDVFDVKKEDSDTVYYVQDYSNEDIQESVVLDRPLSPFAKCPTCSTGFKSLNDGMVHLEKMHFGLDQPEASPPYNAARRLYLRTPTQIQVEARINNIMLIVQECESLFKKLHDEANELRLGAMRSKSSTEKRYPVMKKLVTVFEHIILLLVFTASSASRASRFIMKNEVDDHQCQHIVRSLNRLRLVHMEAQKYLERSKIDIILASKTDSLAGSVTLASIGPQFLIALVSNNLFLRSLKATSGKTIDNCERYKHYTTRLQFQVNQRPKRRLFKDISDLEEELEALRRVIHWQCKFSNNLMRVLEPQSYKTTSKDRISHFNTESYYISRTLEHLKERDLELDALQARTRSLRAQLKQSIEIREESHGKAIRVFTIVTVFFLPLSFVTSFMGMNTTDIRDIDKDQTFFWTLAVPITAFVLGLSFIYGYKWDGWKEDIIRRWKEKCAQLPADSPYWTILSMFPNALPQRNLNDDDIEKGNIAKRWTDLSASSAQQPPKPPKRRVHFRF
ncbi:cora-like Mg2+ transporter protein-domain-containing protein [Whalleya microplaca]|nr:cora-like Mg2+ transporter protein-domain-containing protein [Whalleya microplaca]